MFFNVNIFETVKALHKQWLLLYKIPERIPGKVETNDLL